MKKVEYCVLLSTLCAIGLQVAKTPAMEIAFATGIVVWLLTGCIHQILNYLKGEDK